MHLKPMLLPHTANSLSQSVKRLFAITLAVGVASQNRQISKFISGQSMTEKGQQSAVVQTFLALILRIGEQKTPVDVHSRIRAH